jgi:3-hydroxy-9,10-secoandrosta-1,3,5(10)-triene-9,17-dione monooxygenase reductase component
VPEPGPVDPNEYKRALRKFAGGVTIVTVAEGERIHGMTASSFASVSLDPPLILVCLDKLSQTRSLVHASGSFVINILSSDQEEIARAFSLPGTKPFDQLSHRPARDGAPVFDGVIAWLECKTIRIVEGGDHDVIIGEVVACDANEGEPLLYYDQDYRSFKNPP